MPPDPALLDRTLASIRSNFESLRRFDPIPALMAESPPGPREEFGSGKSPVPPVSRWNHSNCRWLGSSSILEDGKPVAGRDLWVAASGPSVDRLKLAAEAAAGFTTVLRKSVGISESRAHTARDHWFWTVFEVAAEEPPYSVLRLKGGGVFRMAEGGIFCALASDLEEVERNGLPPDEPFGAAILSQDYSPVLYWELKDFVEASLWALDLVAVALPAVIERERGNPGTSRDALLETAEESKPRGHTTDQRLQALYMDPEKLDFVLEASEKDLAKEIGRSGPGAFTNCDFFQQTLRPLRAERRAENQEARRRRKATQKWGHFDSAAGPDVDADEDH